MAEARPLGAHRAVVTLKGGLISRRPLLPRLLVSLHRIPELTTTTQTAEGLWLGAMSTHRTVAAEARLHGAMSVVRHAAGQLAHPASRNLATRGGSVCLADPRTELPGALVAASAR